MRCAYRNYNNTLRNASACNISLQQILGIKVEILTGRVDFLQMRDNLPYDMFLVKTRKNVMRLNQVITAIFAG